jgi:integrase
MQYLRAVERSPRDRVIGRLLFYCGVRIAELVALDDDVPLSARKGKVIVRSGKGETSREIPLRNGTSRASVTEWRTGKQRTSRHGSRPSATNWSRPSARWRSSTSMTASPGRHPWTDRPATSASRIRAHHTMAGQVTNTLCSAP